MAGTTSQDARPAVVAGNGAAVRDAERYDALLGDVPRTVLVVEDDEDAREGVRLLLAGQGLRVLEAGSVGAALETLRGGPVDAVLLDVVLPDGSGHEVSGAMRADPAHERTPVLMLTALDGVQDEVGGVLAGADAYLVKPVSRETLLTRLADVL